MVCLKIPVLVATITDGCGRCKNGWTYVSPGLLKKRHVLCGKCTKCDVPHLVSTLEVSVFAEMLSANIVSWRLGCARIWFASKEPTDSLQPHFQTLILSAPDNGVRDIWIILSEIFYWFVWECSVLGTDLIKLYNKLTIFYSLLLLVFLLNSGILIFAELPWPRTCKKLPE